MGALAIEAAAGMKVSVEQVRHEFWFGSTLPTGGFTGRTSPEDAAKFKEIFTSHFNAGVIEGAFKWHEMEPERGQVNHAVVDRMLARADQQGIPVRGHCLFWGVPNRVEGWVKGLTGDELRLAIRQRAWAIGARYATDLQNTT